jgi:hypothetical protein
MNMALALISARFLLSGIGFWKETKPRYAGNALLLSIRLNLILAIFNMLPLPAARRQQGAGRVSARGRGAALSQLRPLRDDDFCCWCC